MSDAAPGDWDCDFSDGELGGHRYNPLCTAIRPATNQPSPTWFVPRVGGYMEAEAKVKSTCTHLG